MRRETSSAGSHLIASAVGLLLASGCVSAAHYNDMLQQQEALEASLRSEVDADQVKIEQLENGIRVRMSSDLLYASGDVDLNPKGRAALDKVAGRLARMANEQYEIDVVGNTSDGQYHPIADNDSPGGRAKNRRTDLLMRPR